MTSTFTRRVAVVGRLGAYPAVRLSIPGRRAIAYLALRGRSAPRSLAAAELWPDQLEQQARASLRRAIWQLPKGWITTLDEELVLEAQVDLDEARELAARALAGETLSLGQIGLLSGDLLPGWYEEWAVAAQDNFRLLRVQALEAACRSLSAAGEYALAVQAGMAAVAAEPLRESAAAALVQAHLAEGNRYEALQRHRSFAQLLDQTLGVAPDPSLTANVNGFLPPSSDGSGTLAGRSGKASSSRRRRTRDAT
jgi:DNA-binding SARP family transcriptional activator